MNIYYYSVSYMTAIYPSVTKHGYTIANSEQHAIEKIKWEYNREPDYIEERLVIEIE